MPDAGARPIISLEVARKIYRHGAREAVEAVRDLRLTVAPGETVCLIGPSGAGKTTALRILLGLDRAFEGRVVPDPVTLSIGIVFQEPRLLPWRTVETNVRLALPRSERARSLDRLFEEFGLSAWRARYPGELSLGMARRVALARALAVDPVLLVLDEPFVSLDDRAAAGLREAVFEAAARRSTSILMVTHNVREALGVADRIVLLTQRPASVLGEVALTTPREKRTSQWMEEVRSDLAAHYAGAVLA